jgi:hypothetical protein
MNDDFEFLPPVFFRVLIITSGIYFLIVFIIAIVQPVSDIFHNFIENPSANLNRIGLILQSIGLFSILPDLLGKKDAIVWEKRLRLMGKKINFENASIIKTTLTLSTDMLSQTTGVVGFVGQISRVLAFISLNFIAIYFYRSDYSNSILFDILGIAILLSAYSWLLTELSPYIFQVQNNQSSNKSLRIIRIVNMFVCGGVAFFIPLLILVLPIANLLSWITKHNLKTVFATITFPFILLGTLLQLIGSFL